MLSQQELSDRFEIQDLVFHYADLIDRKQFQALRDSVFTPDAYIDYSAFGGSVGSLDDTVTFLEAALTNTQFPATQHLNANVQIALNGGEASGRVMCFNPMEMTIEQGAAQTYFLGLWYIDSYRRTPAGWRISRRVEEKSWVFNAPEFMNL